MKILLWSNAFHPVIGGLQAASRMLAEEFVFRGHEVTVVTRTGSAGRDDFPFAVVRRPSRLQVLRLVKQCDVYLQNHISVAAAWPLLLFRRPWVVAQHTWIPRSDVRGLAKHFALRYARLIACSKEIAADLKYPSTVICSPYDDRVFRERSELRRDRALLFVGRLAREKGVHILLKALRLLKAERIEPQLTIVGGGPERDSLAQQAYDFGVVGQVDFAGPKDPHEIATLMNQHRILVVPSILEPFGIVALEGIACGCLVVGSDGGGLGGAIGRCGVTFPTGDAAALAACLASALRKRGELRECRDCAASHLRLFTRAAVAGSYLRVLETAYAAVST